jgi:hypothetical protein
MQIRHCEYRVVPIAATVIVLLGQFALGQDITGDVLNDARSKGVVVLRATFPSRGEVWRVSLLSSKHGEHFTQAGIGALDRRLLWSAIDDGEVTTVFVPALGRYGEDASFFGGPGLHWLRWTITFRDQSKPRSAEDQGAKDIEPVEIVQTLEVEPMLPQDGRFLARISDVEWLRTFLGAEFHKLVEDEAHKWFLSPDGADHRALIVIGELLKATRYEEPWTVAGKLGSVQRAVERGDALWELARDIPDSSYAPYAAFYAGCCYMAGVGDAIKKEHGTLVTPMAKQVPLFEKAEAALAFAVERGDRYLQPRAIYNQAFLAMVAADWAKANAVMERGYALAGARGTARARLESLNGHIQKARADFARRSEPGRK